MSRQNGKSLIQTGANFSIDQSKEHESLKLTAIQHRSKAQPKTVENERTLDLENTGFDSYDLSRWNSSENLLTASDISDFVSNATPNWESNRNHEYDPLESVFASLFPDYLISAEQFVETPSAQHLCEDFPIFDESENQPDFLGGHIQSTESEDFDIVAFLQEYSDIHDMTNATQTPSPQKSNQTPLGKLTYVGTIQTEARSPENESFEMDLGSNQSGSKTSPTFVYPTLMDQTEQMWRSISTTEPHNFKTNYKTGNCMEMGAQTHINDYQDCVIQDSESSLFPASDGMPNTEKFAEARSNVIQSVEMDRNEVLSELTYPETDSRTEHLDLDGGLTYSFTNAASSFGLSSQDQCFPVEFAFHENQCFEDQPLMLATVTSPRIDDQLSGGFRDPQLPSGDLFRTTETNMVRVDETQDSALDHVDVPAAETVEIPPEFIQTDPSLTRTPESGNQEQSIERLLVCDTCSEHFHNRARFCDHVCNVHPNQPIYACMRCEKKYGKRTGLTAHFRRCHKDKYCLVCLDVFEDSEALSKHAMIHRDREKMCIFCARFFKHNYDLINHYIQCENKLVLTESNKRKRECSQEHDPMQAKRQNTGLIDPEGKSTCSFTNTASRFDSSSHQQPFSNESDFLEYPSIEGQPLLLTKITTGGREDDGDTVGFEHPRIQSGDQFRTTETNIAWVDEKQASSLSRVGVPAAGTIAMPATTIETENFIQTGLNSTRNPVSGNQEQSVERLLVCDTCMEPFHSRARFCDHVCNVHPNQPIYACAGCTKKYNSREILIKHASTYHANKCCKVCFDVFKDSVALSRHEMIHGGRKTMCFFCSRFFNYGSDLALHYTMCRNKHAKRKSWCLVNESTRPEFGSMPSEKFLVSPAGLRTDGITASPLDPFAKSRSWLGSFCQSLQFPAQIQQAGGFEQRHQFSYG